MSCALLSELCEDPDCASYIPDEFCAALAESNIDRCSYCSEGTYMEAAIPVSRNINQEDSLGVNGFDVGIIILSFIVVGMVIVALLVVIRWCGLMNSYGNIGSRWQYNQISDDDDTNNTNTNTNTKIMYNV